MRSLTIVRRIQFSIVIVLAVMAVTAFLTWNYVREINEEINMIGDIYINTTQLVGDAEYTLISLQLDLNRLITADYLVGDALRMQVEDQLARADELLRAQLQNLEVVRTNAELISEEAAEEARYLVEDFGYALEDIGLTQDTVANMRREDFGVNDPWKNELDYWITSTTQLSQYLSDFRTQLWDEVDSRVAYAEEMTAATLRAVFFGFAVAFLFILVMLGMSATFRLRKIALKLRSDSLVSSERASDSQDTVNQLQQAADRVRQVFDEFRASLDEVSQGSLQSSSALEQVTKSVAEVAGTIGTLAEQAQQNLEIGEETYAQVSQSGEQVAFGAQVLSDTVKAMESLQSAVQRIEQIAGSIMGISDQTNLLALNAAIEAARAGENGRGFAVVADEVRQLAEESNQATAKIQTILREVNSATTAVIDRMTGNDGNDKMNMTVVFSHLENLASTVGAKMQQLVEVSKKQAEASQDVSAAVQEISAGGEQVSAQVSEASKATQSMATQIEEVRRQVEQLRSGIDNFSETISEQASMAADVENETKKLI